MRMKWEIGMRSLLDLGFIVEKLQIADRHDIINTTICE